VVGEEGTPNFPKDKSGAQRAIHRLSQRRTWGVFFFVMEKKHNNKIASEPPDPIIFDGSTNYF
jgi:hypothetical protein